MTTWTLALLSVVAVSLVSLMGVVTLSLDEARLRRLATVLVSFAVGALLGDAFIHLIPQAFAGVEAVPRSSLLVLAGMLLFFVVESHPRAADDRSLRGLVVQVGLVSAGIAAMALLTLLE